MFLAHYLGSDDPCWSVTLRSYTCLHLLIQIRRGESNANSPRFFFFFKARLLTSFFSHMSLVGFLCFVLLFLQRNR